MISSCHCTIIKNTWLGEQMLYECSYCLSKKQIKIDEEIQNLKAIAEKATDEAWEKNR